MAAPGPTRALFLLFVLAAGACGRDVVHGPPLDDAAVHFTCPMHPGMRAPAAGPCPLCGMPLERVAATSAGEVRIDPETAARLGVRSEPVVRRSLALRIRAPGRVVLDPDLVHDLTLRYRGWVGEVLVEDGEPVERGEPVLTVYSPELDIAQRQYQGALELERQAGGERGRRPGEQVAQYLQELHRWHVDRRTIARLAAGGPRLEFVPIGAPRDGMVVERHAVAGAAVEAGEPLLRIAGLERVRVEAEVWHDEISLVYAGARAAIVTVDTPPVRLEAAVAAVHAGAHPDRPAGRVRFDLDNPHHVLRPGAPVDVEIAVPRPESPVVPEDAVIYAGPRRIVFLDLGGGRYQPREVAAGARAAGLIEIRSGLAAGDRVVSAGTFLVAAESRLRSAAAW